jgi:hypothetical protein
MMKISKVARVFFSTSPKENFALKIPHPTMAESFETKFPKEQLEKLMNPKGFLDPNEKENYTFEEPQQNTEGNEGEKTQMKPEEIKECGFKVKGPEPTRFGDWEKKGRCIDF